MHRIRLALALCLPVVLAACGGGVRESGVPLPSYGIGDSYSFDDGTTRAVTATSDDEVFWRGNDHATLVTSRDLLLPPIQDNAPAMQISRRLSDPGLFPLTRGKHVAFTAVTEWRGRARAIRAGRESWQCRVRGHEPMTTAAGSFDTIRIECSVRPEGGGPALQHTYFYAPSIAYVVRRDDGPGHRVNLIRYTVGNPVLSDIALQQRSEAIQQALEHRVSGQPVRWRDVSSDASGTAEPVLTERSPRFGWCREFREHMQIAERDYDLLGTACRDQGGIWLVRRVTPYRTAAR